MHRIIPSVMEASEVWDWLEKTLLVGEFVPEPVTHVVSLSLRDNESVIGVVQDTGARTFCAHDEPLSRLNHAKQPPSQTPRANATCFHAPQDNTLQNLVKCHESEGSLLSAATISLL